MDESDLKARWGASRSCRRSEVELLAPKPPRGDLDAAFQELVGDGIQSDMGRLRGGSRLTAHGCGCWEGATRRHGGAGHKATRAMEGCRPQHHGVWWPWEASARHQDATTSKFRQEQIQHSCARGREILEAAPLPGQKRQLAAGSDMGIRRWG